MSKVRGVEVFAERSNSYQKWRWKAKGIRWDFRLQPTRRLFRAGVMFDDVGGVAQLLCVDDAVLYSLGFEEGTLADLNRGSE